MKKTLLGLRALMSVPKDNPDLVKAQYIALSRQLPMMYFILLINTMMLAGTHFTVAPRWLVVYCPMIMTVFGLVRGIEWVRTRRRVRSPAQMVTALKRTNTLAPFVAVAFTAWSLALFPYGDSYTRAHVAFYMAITVIGCIFCMMHLLPAALATTLWSTQRSWCFSPPPPSSRSLPPRSMCCWYRSPCWSSSRRNTPTSPGW